LSMATLLMFTVLRVIPLSVGGTLAGATFAQSRAVLLIFALSQLASSIGAGAMSGLRYAGRTGDATAIRVLWALILVIGAAVGSELAGGAGFCVALLVANILTAVAWWVRLGMVTGDRGQAQYIGIRAGAD